VKECCEVQVDVPERQRRLLWVVPCINGAMFLVELIAGITASSTALLADSVDMLGDAIVYGVSLYVVARGAVWQARVARLKALIMAAFGVGVLAQVVTKLLHGLHPNADTMSVVGSLALAANTVCLVMLWRRRHDDVNMRSAWMCSLNDVAGNAGVIVGGAAVALTASGWPDILVGLMIAGMFCASATHIIRAAAARPA
jgi:Co/Zn/Cd efflux system component